MSGGGFRVIPLDGVTLPRRELSSPMEMSFHPLAPATELASSLQFLSHRGKRRADVPEGGTSEAAQRARTEDPGDKCTIELLFHARDILGDDAFAAADETPMRPAEDNSWVKEYLEASCSLAQARQLGQAELHSVKAECLLKLARVRHCPHCFRTSLAEESSSPVTLVDGPSHIYTVELPVYRCGALHIYILRLLHFFFFLLLSC